MPSAKCNFAMKRAMDLMSSLLNVASSQDVPFGKMPFHQLQYLQYMYHGLTCSSFCVPVPFADNSRCQFTMAWDGFSLIFSCFFPAFLETTWIHYRESFLYCCLFEMLCNEWSIATNEVQWPPHFQCVKDYWDEHHGFFCFSPSLFIMTGFMQRSFLHVCDAV